MIFEHESPFLPQAKYISTHSCSTTQGVGSSPKYKVKCCSGPAARPPIPPRGSPGGGAAAATAGGHQGVPDPGGSRRQSLMDRLKRAASQPSLAGLPSGLASGLAVPKGIVKAAEALLARSDSGSSAGASASLRGSASAPGMAEPAAVKAPAPASAVSTGCEQLHTQSSSDMWHMTFHICARFHSSREGTFQPCGQTSWSST